jgi:hypothetical protein
MKNNLDRWKGKRQVGRPKGSKNKVPAAFLSDLHEFWVKKTRGKEGSTVGQNLLIAAAEKDPMGFVKTVAALVPKEVQKEETLNVNFLDAIKKINEVEAIDITPPPKKELEEIIDVRELEEGN